MSKPVFKDLESFSGRHNRWGYFLFTLAVSFTSAVNKEKFAIDFVRRFSKTNSVAVLFRDRKQAKGFESCLVE